VGKSKTGTAKRDAEQTSALRNLFLNVLIFILTVLILYMGYSLFLKINGVKKPINKALLTEQPSDIIQAEVLNGCGISGLAERFTDYLREHGIDVVSMDNYNSYNLPETVVIDRSGNKANARKVAKILGVKNKNVIQEIDPNSLLDVSVIIGRDYLNLKPIK
jgi:hypothetical protein